MTATSASTTVDHLLAGIATGVVRAGLFTDDARLDAVVPNWRFAVTGSGAVAAVYGRWFHPRCSPGWRPPAGRLPTRPNPHRERDTGSPLVELRPALAGHAAFEVYSVLTRLPVPLRLGPTRAAQVLAAAFPEPCWLSDAHCDELRGLLGDVGILGGSVYDALVGRAAAVHGRVLLTRDRRAERTYRALDVPYDVVA